MDKKCIICDDENELEQTSPLCFKCTYELPARLGFKIIALHISYRDAIRDALHWKETQKLRVHTKQTAVNQVNSEVKQEPETQN
jgi:hypothetical protein